VSRPPTNEELRATWDANAAYWDDSMQAGKTWQRALIAPVVEELLAVRRGERVLEIACGNGEFSRRMSELGARVTATDFSERMLERAREHGGDVDYRPVDATDAAALDGLASDNPFDGVVCSMALMDMSDLEPLAASLPKLLRPRGRFVFSIQHPAFNTVGAVRMIEQRDVETEVVLAHAIKLTAYRSMTTGRGIALMGQPVAQWYFDRPLDEVLRPFLDQGLVLDGLREPTLDPTVTDPATPEYVFTEIPPVLVARLRVG
jgi:2-polyprenyl-3-methyl-5-hydroxy-6-metoxy-1,4-benzoquinol methylase